jgi:hypothetical protein
VQVLEHRLNEFRPTTLRIQIFIAQDQLAAALSRALCRNPECACVAEMKQSGRRGPEPTSVMA